MARATLTPTKLIGNGGRTVPDAAANADGYTVETPIVSFTDRAVQPMQRTVLVVDRSAATGAMGVVVRGSQVEGRTAAGGADDQAVNCVAGEVTYVGPFEGGRFAQDDGSLRVDLTGTLTGTTVGALVLPTV